MKYSWAPGYDNTSHERQRILGIRKNEVYVCMYRFYKRNLMFNERALREREISVETRGLRRGRVNGRIIED